MRCWIHPILASRGVTEADVRAGIHMPVLRRLCSIPHREIRLARGVYSFGDRTNAADHVTNDGGAYDALDEWQPEWRAGYGPPLLADGVALIWQEGVVLVDRAEVGGESVRFVSLHFLYGIQIASGSLTMEKCTSSGESIHVHQRASLVMLDCRVFDSVGNAGVDCDGKVKLTLCIIEGSERYDVLIYDERALGELVDCVIRKNGAGGGSAGHGVRSYDLAVVQRGGTISENSRGGASAALDGKVTVAKAEENPRRASRKP